MSAAARDPIEVVRDEMAMHAPIRRALADGPHTIPELAQALGRPAREVLVWVMGMRRYGEVEPVGEAGSDGYVRYRAIQGAGR